MFIAKRDRRRTKSSLAQFGSALGARVEFGGLNLSEFGSGIGGSGGTRTHDPRFRRPMLYPLSYAPTITRYPHTYAIK